MQFYKLRQQTTNTKMPFQRPMAQYHWSNYVKKYLPMNFVEIVEDIILGVKKCIRL